MTDNANTQINDAQLNDVAGGMDMSDIVYGKSEEIVNARGQVVGKHVIETGVVLYWPCKKCGKPMHKGTMAARYCDPCDDWFLTYTETKYNGTVEELKAASL